MSYERALNRAKSINAKTFLSIERLPHGLGFVASYANDQSLRCVGQTVIHHADGRYGIVLDQNGFVVAEMEARDLVHVCEILQLAGEVDSSVLLFGIDAWI
nr:hypothetical protein [Yoonia sp.]